MILAAAVLLALAGPSDEATCLELLEQGRFADLAAFLEKLPKDSALRASLEAPVRRLADIHARLVASINRRAQRVELKDVHPASTRGGVLAGATATSLRIRDGDHERPLIWPALPPSVTLELARKYLEDEAAADAGLLRDLADGLGVPESLKPVHAVRKAVGDRSLEAALAAWGEAGTPKPAGPWGAVASRWLERLAAARDAREKRKEAVARSLPKGAELQLWDDFEEGPELVAPAWDRGVTRELPEAGGPANRWCRRTVFAGRNLDWGEMLDQFRGATQTPPAPAFTLKENTWFSCRIYAVNTIDLRIGLDVSPEEQRGVRFALVVVRIPARDRWVDLRVRLDDASLHQRFRGIAPARVGDPIWRIAFMAERLDKNLDRPGMFHLDDVRIATIPPVEAEEK